MQICSCLVISWIGALLDLKSVCAEPAASTGTLAFLSKGGEEALLHMQQVLGSKQFNPKTAPLPTGLASDAQAHDRTVTGSEAAEGGLDSAVDESTTALLQKKVSTPALATVTDVSLSRELMALRSKASEFHNSATKRIGKVGGIHTSALQLSQEKRTKHSNTASDRLYFQVHSDKPKHKPLFEPVAFLSYVDLYHKVKQDETVESLAASLRDPLVQGIAVGLEQLTPVRKDHYTPSRRDVEPWEFSLTELSDTEPSRMTVLYQVRVPDLATAEAWKKSFENSEHRHEFQMAVMDAFRIHSAAQGQGTGGGSVAQVEEDTGETSVVQMPFAKIIQHPAQEHQDEDLIPSLYLPESSAASQESDKTAAAASAKGESASEESPGDLPAESSFLHGVLQSSETPMSSEHTEAKPEVKGRGDSADRRHDSNVDGADSSKPEESVVSTSLSEALSSEGRSELGSGTETSVGLKSSDTPARVAEPLSASGQQSQILESTHKTAQQQTATSILQSSPDSGQRDSMPSHGSQTGVVDTHTQSTSPSHSFAWDSRVPSAQLPWASSFTNGQSFAPHPGERLQTYRLESPGRHAALGQKAPLIGEYHWQPELPTQHASMLGAYQWPSPLQTPQTSSFMPQGVRVGGGIADMQASLIEGYQPVDGMQPVGGAQAPAMSAGSGSMAQMQRAQLQHILTQNQVEQASLTQDLQMQKDQRDWLEQQDLLRTQALVMAQRRRNMEQMQRLRKMQSDLAAQQVTPEDMMAAQRSLPR